MDVLDRVLDKGVVIDAWVRLSLVGIDLVTVNTRVIVASIETDLNHSAVPADVKSTARPRGERPRRLSLAESIGLAGAAAVPITPRMIVSHHLASARRGCR